MLSKTVRYIFHRFLQNASTGQIARELLARNIPNARGEVKWPYNSVRTILRYEKYKGDAILQKTFSNNFLTHERMVNNGEVAKYYVENSHPAIVTREQWDKAQELLRRYKTSHSSAKMNVYCGKIFCGKCNAVYGRKVSHSNDKYRRYIFNCNRRYDKKCKSDIVSEAQIHNAFITAVNQVIANKEQILNLLNETVALLCPTEELSLKIAKLNEELGNLEKDLRPGKLGTSTVATIEKYKKKQKEATDLVNRKLENDATRGKLITFIQGIENQEALITEFDKDLFCTLCDKIVIYSKKDIRVFLMDGNEYRV